MDDEIDPRLQGSPAFNDATQAAVDMLAKIKRIVPAFQKGVQAALMEVCISVASDKPRAGLAAVSAYKVLTGNTTRKDAFARQGSPLKQMYDAAIAAFLKEMAPAHGEGGA